MNNYNNGKLNTLLDKLIERLIERKVSKAVFTVDMNNGFVNFGAMANNEYNKLVPEQIKIIEKFRKEGQAINFVLEGHNEDATEFLTYPKHCVKGTKEAELIPELKKFETLDDVAIFYKNSINGMLNQDVWTYLRLLNDLNEIVIQGVCADLCVMDFARTLARYLDEINKKAKIFVVRKGIDTFDAPGHDRKEWLDIAEKVMTQAGIEYVDDVKDLEVKERIYHL